MFADHPDARLQPVSSQHVPVSDGQTDDGVTHPHVAPQLRDKVVPVADAHNALLQAGSLRQYRLG